MVNHRNSRNSKVKNVEVSLLKLQGILKNLKDQEARERCIKIFGSAPKNYTADTEELFGEVARVFCHRKFGTRQFLESHEYIQKWHNATPKTTVEEFLAYINEYCSGG